MKSMAQKIKSIDLSNLSLDEVTKKLPADLTRTYINNCGIGLQPPQTYLLTSVHKAYNKLKRKEVTCKKLTVKEVQEDGSDGALFVDLAVYGQHAEEFDEVLSKLGKMQQGVWLILQHVKISDYHGCFQDTWAKVSLGVGVGGAAAAVDAPDAEVWVLSPATSQPHPKKKRQPPHRCLKRLADCCESQVKVTVCVVIQRVVRRNSLTRHGTTFSRFSVVDPSCTPFKEFTVMVFFNKESSDDLQNVRASDIVIIWEMQVSLYNGEYNGTVYSPKQVVKFSSDLSDPVDPVTSSTSFRMTDDYEKAVIELRKWWAEEQHRYLREDKNNAAKNKSVENREEDEQEDTSHHPKISSYATIQDISGESTVSLSCQVVKIGAICVTGTKFTVLRVQDGTHTRVDFMEYDFDGGMDEEQSIGGSDVRKVCSSGSRTVDVLVPAPPQHLTLSEITVNCFVRLINIDCCKVREERTKRTGYVLSYIAMKSTITRISPEDPELHRLISRLSSVSGPSEVSGKDTPLSPHPANTSRYLFDHPKNREQPGDIHPDRGSESTVNGNKKRVADSQQRPMRSCVRPSPIFATQRRSPPLVATVVSGEFEKSTLTDVVKQGITGEVYEVKALPFDLKLESLTECHVTHHSQYVMPSGGTYLYLLVWGVCVECGFCLSGQNIIDCYPHHLLTQPTLPCSYCQAEVLQSLMQSDNDGGGCTTQMQPEPALHRVDDGMSLEPQQERRGQRQQQSNCSGEGKRDTTGAAPVGGKQTTGKEEPTKATPKQWEQTMGEGATEATSKKRKQTTEEETGVVPKRGKETAGAVLKGGEETTGAVPKGGKETTEAVPKGRKETTEEEETGAVPKGGKQITGEEKTTRAASKRRNQTIGEEEAIGAAAVGGNQTTREETTGAAAVGGKQTTREKTVRAAAVGEKQTMREGTTGAAAVGGPGEGENESIGAATYTVHPIILITVELADPETGFVLPCVLAGDHSKDFFGVSCGFSWLVAEGDEDSERKQSRYLKGSKRAVNKKYR